MKAECEYYNAQPDVILINQTKNKHNNSDINIFGLSHFCVSITFIDLNPILRVEQKSYLQV